LRRILNGIISKQIPDRVGNGAGSQGIFKGGFLKSATTNQHQPFW